MPEGAAQRPALLAALDRWTHHPVISNALGGLIALGVAALISWGASVVFGGGKSSAPGAHSVPTGASSTAPISKSQSSSASSSTTPASVALPPQALSTVLVSQSAFQALTPDSSWVLQSDSGNQAVQGGIQSLKLCNTAIPADGLGASGAESYTAGGPLGDPNVYYGSDAAGFATVQDATRFLTAASEQAPTCGWRQIPGPRLDGQVVRLTAQQKIDVEGPVQTDVILVREANGVAELGASTINGSHSSDAERLAEGMAQRLAQAVHAATAIKG